MAVKIVMCSISACWFASNYCICHSRYANLTGNGPFTGCSLVMGLWVLFPEEWMFFFFWVLLEIVYKFCQAAFAWMAVIRVLACACRLPELGSVGHRLGIMGRLQRAGTTEHHIGQDHIRLWGRYPHTDRNQVVAACQCRTIQIFSLQHWGGRWSGMDHSLRQSAATSKGVLYIRQDHCGALLTSARGGACGCAVAYPRHRDNQMPDSRRKCQRSMEWRNLAFHWRVFNHQ